MITYEGHVRLHQNLLPCSYLIAKMPQLDVSTRMCVVVLVSLVSIYKLLKKYKDTGSGVDLKR